MIRHLEHATAMMKLWTNLAARLATSGEFLFDQLLPFETPLTPLPSVTAVTLAKN